MITKKIKIGEVKSLLNSGKKIKVKTINDEYVSITKFIEKGILDTYEVVLDNDFKIKVSHTHRFFTNVGWLETKEIVPYKTTILCDDKKYHLVISVNYLGKYRIVDVMVDHPDHCYFGNGMLNHNTGKSLICGQIIAQTQKRGGIAIFFDSEFSVDRDFWKAIGINLKDVPYIPFTTLEEYFTQFEQVVATVRKDSPDRLITILTDSVTQASVEKEMEEEHGISGYNTGRAITISKAMRKCLGLIARQRILPIFTNQVRYNMNAGPFGDKWIVPGGKGLPFACSVRIRLANLGKLKKSDEVIGINCQAQVIKNRCGPSYRTAGFEVHYDSGIQDLASWIEYMSDHSIITGDGKSGYKYKTEAGEKIEFKTPEFVELMNTNATLREEVYQTICKNYIMKYRDPNSKIVEDVECTGDENDDITANAVKDE